MTKAMRKAASEAIVERAKARAADLAPTVAELRREPLQRASIRGTGTWFATQVARVLARSQWPANGRQLDGGVCRMTDPGEAVMCLPSLSISKTIGLTARQPAYRRGALCCSTRLVGARWKRRWPRLHHRAGAALTARRVPSIGDQGTNSFKVTAMEWRVPSRLISSRTIVPSARRVRLPNSACPTEAAGRPSITVIKSPARMPALAAGVSGWTVTTRKFSPTLAA
jgi:hypothetical protein